MTGTSLQIQSVLFNNEPKDILRAVQAIDRAASTLKRARDVALHIHYGDCSPQRPCLEDGDLDRIRAALTQGTLSYSFFNANLGSAEGHNRLAAGLTEGYVLIQNPDVVGEAQYLQRLFEVLENSSCGMAEARQLPIEHPKDYSLETGETSWATTACAMIPVPIFNRLSGFDSKSFFLYCDDVDFSWRVRLEGLKVIYQPDAIVFHDKRLNRDGSWNPSGAERYYSVEAALLMARKYSRPERIQDILRFCDQCADDVFIKAAARYRQLERDGQLPEPIDPEHEVSEFLGDNYAPHRFVI